MSFCRVWVYSQSNSYVYKIWNKTTQSVGKSIGILISVWISILIG